MTESRKKSSAKPPKEARFEGKKDGDEDEMKPTAKDKGEKPWEKGCKDEAGDKMVKRKKGAVKAEDADDDTDDDDDEDMDKSEGITPASLEKSLRAIGRYVEANDQGDRREALLSKAQRTELSKSESSELYGILSGQPQDAEPSLGEAMHKSMDEDEAVAGTVDVSSYVEGLHAQLNKSLGMAGSAIEALDERQHNFNLLNARCTYQIGGLLKSIDARLAQIEGAPVAAPRSRGVQGAAPLHKSFAGSTSQPGEQLNKSQVLDLLDEMVAKSAAEGRPGLSKGGEDLVRAVAKYEQMTQISAPLVAELREFQANRSGR